MKPETQEWLLYAEHDFEAAGSLFSHYPLAPEIVAFHCQQCAEKYLKALLVEAGVVVPRLHDLAVLCLKAAEYYPALYRYESVSDCLTPFGTIARYPGGTVPADENELRTILDWTRSIRIAVRTELGLDNEKTGDAAEAATRP